MGVIRRLVTVVELQADKAAKALAAYDRLWKQTATNLATSVPANRSFPTLAPAVNFAGSPGNVVELQGPLPPRVRLDEALGLPPLALHPPSTRRARAASLRRALRRWLVIATLSWLGFGLTASVRLHQRLAIAEQELAALRQPMEALHTARGRMTTAQAIIEALASATRERGRLSGLLLAVARGLPDSVVLTTLDLHMDGPGAMAGLAANPLAVVAALERLPGFNSPHLDGPPLRDPEDPAGWSSFSVGFGVVAR